MRRNLFKHILWILILAECFPLLAIAGSQQKEQRYKIAVCDWMILKRQKIGSFQLVHELNGDGVVEYGYAETFFPDEERIELFTFYSVPVKIGRAHV